MDNTRKLFLQLKEQLNSNEMLEKKELYLSDYLFQELLNIYKEEQNVTYPKKYEQFNLEIAYNIRFEWKLKEKNYGRLNEPNDGSFITGRIWTFGPSEMIADNDNNYWKDIFWFKQSKTKLNEQLKNFVPFEWGDGFHCVTGFMKTGNKKDGFVLSDELYLNRENKELVRHPFSFDEYIEFILKTKGYLYFLDYYNEPKSEEFERFMRVMPQLFDDFDADYFKRLSKKK